MSILSNEEARLTFRYHFSLKLMENLPAKCLCGHNVGDGTHLLVCKRVNAGQIAAHDMAVRLIGAELNSYGVIVKYEQIEYIFNFLFYFYLSELFTPSTRGGPVRPLNY